jgi:hypothetical protein
MTELEQGEGKSFHAKYIADSAPTATRSKMTAGSPFWGESTISPLSSRRTLVRPHTHPRPSPSIHPSQATLSFGAASDPTNSRTSSLNVFERCRGAHSAHCRRGGHRHFSLVQSKDGRLEEVGEHRDW